MCSVFVPASMWVQGHLSGGVVPPGSIVSDCLMKVAVGSIVSDCLMKVAVVGLTFLLFSDWMAGLVAIRILLG